MHVKYTGPGSGRDVRLSNGNEVHVPKGQAAEVPDADGKNLCKQKHWEEVKETATRAADKPKATKGGDQ